MIRPHARFLSAFAAACVLLAVLSGVTAPSAQAAIEVAPAEWQQLKLINKYRAENGAPRLIMDTKLMRTAQWMGRSMAKHRYFSHTDHLGRDPFDRLASFKYPSNTWRGENLAAGYPDAPNTFTQWRESPGHNRNMLNRNYRAIGIALVEDPNSEYGHYWVTEFGSMVTSRIPSARTRARLSEYSPAKRRKIKRMARRCERTKRGSRAWKRRKCGWNMRTARQLRALAM